MTVQDLRDLLVGLSEAEGALEVCRQDSDYGARTLETATVVYTVVPGSAEGYQRARISRERWTYDTREEAALAADEHARIVPVVLLR